MKYRTYLRQGVLALQADPQRAAWKRRTYQTKRRRRNQTLESAWQVHCRDTIAIVSQQGDGGSILEFNPHKLPELIEHLYCTPEVWTGTDFCWSFWLPMLSICRPDHYSDWYFYPSHCFIYLISLFQCAKRNWIHGYMYTKSKSVFKKMYRKQTKCSSSSSHLMMMTVMKAV